MRREIQLLAGIVVLAMAAPAPAQKVRDHRRPRGPILSVSDFQPRSGPVGTVVTVRGVGFTPRTRVLVGGRPARTHNVRPRSLQFRIPAGTRGGRIILRHPGVARDVFVGQFAIAVALTVQQVAPNAGAPGTRVEIRGRGFRRGDVVRLSGMPLRVFSIGPRRIVAAIPAGARPGPIVVVRPKTSIRAQGPRFTVLQPPPTIQRIDPAAGVPGMRVRLWVNAVAPSATVQYGRIPVRVMGRGPNWLDVQVPARARRGRFFIVSGPNGRARSPRPFSLSLPPRIDRIAPTFGLGGHRVEIYGTNFRAGDVITLNGRRLPIQLLRANRISVVVPRRSRTGPLVLERGTMRVASPMAYERVRRPRIRDIQPRFGQPNQEVAIRGRALTPDATVMYGAQPLRVVRREGNRTLFVRIPRRASDQFFTVRTRGGTVRSPVSFQVHRYPRVRSAAPARGIPGTKIVLQGRKLRNATAIYIGNTRVAIKRRARGRMMVVVPESATSGRIDVESYGQRQPTSFQFTVLQYPIINGFAPRVGYPGAQVTVTGMHFTNTTQVFLGKRPLTVVRRQLPTQLVVQLPRRVRGSKFFWATDHGAKVRSQGLFKIISPASLSGFSPKQAKPGSHVALAGVDMNRVKSVLVGNQPAHIVRRMRSTGIVIEVPPTLRKGAYYVWLRERTGTVRSATKLRVLPPARGRAVVPPAAPRGVTVRIRGNNFDNDTKASFRGVELPVVRVGRWGRVMWVRIPNNVSGAGSVIIDDGGRTSRVPGTFRILERPGRRPPPPAPPGRVRRH